MEKTLVKNFWVTPAGLLLVGAVASGAVAWWLIAWPVLTFANVAAHPGHFAGTFVHMLGGTAMLFLGALNLYLGLTRRQVSWHRRLGQIYLALGGVGAMSAIGITLSPAHKPAGGTILTNTTLSLAMLGLAWLVFTAMGWRAVRNKRMVSHQDWMIRSYVLVWSFVFCRLASRVPEVGGLGSGSAFVWLSWIAPLLICEVALQWRAGAASK